MFKIWEILKYCIFCGKKNKIKDSKYDNDIIDLNNSINNLDYKFSSNYKFNSLSQKNDLTNIPKAFRKIKKYILSKDNLINYPNITYENYIILSK